MSTAMNTGEKAAAKVAAFVAELQANPQGASRATVDMIVKHWAAYVLIGEVPDEDHAGSVAAIHTEVAIKGQLLTATLSAGVPADMRVMGHYLGVLTTVDEWWLDDDAIDGLMLGLQLAGTARAQRKAA